MLYCTDERFAPNDNAASWEGRENSIPLAAFPAYEKAGELLHASLASDSSDSILVWNHYAGVKMKFKRLSGCLPDRCFNTS